MSRARQITFGLVMVGTLMVSACSSGPATLPKAQVESQISSKIESSGGVKPDSTSCPNDLEGTAGAKMTCTVTTAGKATSADVVVADVTGNTVNFNITLH